jgi:hypothetical protein
LQVVARTKLLRSLQAGSSQVTFLVTKVTNPVSMKPSSSFSILLSDASGSSVEQLGTNLTVRNSYPGNLSYSQVHIVPQSYQTGAVTTYIVTFTPMNYLQLMYLTVYMPQELSINSSAVDCKALSGISGTLACSYNQTARTIKVLNGFPSAYFAG